MPSRSCSRRPARPTRSPRSRSCSSPTASSRWRAPGGSRWAVEPRGLERTRTSTGPDRQRLESRRAVLEKGERQWPPIHYDEQASLDALAGQARRGARLRLAGPRSCAEPEGLGLRRDGRAAQGLAVVGAGRGRRLHSRRRARGRLGRRPGRDARCPTSTRRPSTRRPSSRTSLRAPRSCSRTASTSTSGRSARPRTTT